MADMSQDEKRAAGWRKLKKYQQHKTTSNSSKTTKKKQSVSNEPNGEPYSFFTGFSDSQETSIIDHSKMHHSMLAEEGIGSIIPQSSSNEINDALSEYSHGDLNVSLVSLDESRSPPSLGEKDRAEKSVPLSSSIFSNSFPAEKSHFSDFFDNIRLPTEPNVGNEYSSVDQNSSMSNISFDQYEHECLERQSVMFETSVKDPEANTIENNEGYSESMLNVNNFDVSSLHKNSEIEGTKVILEKNDQNIQNDDTQANLASSAESLRQLSIELSGLIDSSVSSPTTHSTLMEKRNQELAALHASEKEKSEKLQMQMLELETVVSNLRAQLFQHQTDTQVKLQQELGPLQEQLQLHIQTVGILVGEKTELEAALSKSQQTAKQKAVEVEELQGRLKASRHRVGELERELSSVNGSIKQMDNTVQEQSKDLLRIKLEKEMISKQLEESEEETSELRQNLDVKSAEVVRLQQEVQEKTSQLDLAQLRVQQLSLSDSSDVEKQLESLHQQKVSLERQVTELQQSIQTVGSERDQANNQYQEYLHHVNSHLKNMADKLAAATAENEQLTNREQSLVKHLSELEKQLQQHQQLQQQQQRNRLKDSPLHAGDMERLKELEKNVMELKEEKEKIAIDLDCQVQENKSLKDQLELYSSRVDELEILIDNLKADQPDSRKLLAAMESDKVAAARAVEQNQMLKEQLEELQEGFIQMTNNKLELTEQVQKEQLLSKELAERIAEQELEISELRSQLKETQVRIENTTLEKTAEELEQSKAQTFTIQALENDVNQYKKQCQSLQSENNELLLKLTQSAIAISTEEDIQKDSVIESLKASVCQLTMERDRLLLQHSESKTPMINKGTDVIYNALHSHEVNITEYSSLKDAMEKLQERFRKTMEEVAELSDEKQRLEHLVLQLQGETETIGEYIALYQKQRSILRQRAQEKDEQLARLARDREEVKVKLNELNRLIGQLVTENVQKGNNSNSDIEASDVGGTTIKVFSEHEGLINGDVASRNDLDNTEDRKEGELNSQVQPAKTADKIIALLSEIETSTLVEPRSVENFHPCPWCSGRLITV